MRGARPRPAKATPPVIPTEGGEFIITGAEYAPPVRFELSLRQAMNLYGGPCGPRRHYVVRGLGEPTSRDPDEAA
jgi:hypothetical protein